MRIRNKLLITLAFCGFMFITSAQKNKSKIKDTHQLIFKYDTVSKSFGSNISKGLKARRRYELVVIGAHSGLYNLKVSANQFNQSSKSPEVLKFLSLSATDLLLKAEESDRFVSTSKDSSEIIHPDYETLLENEISKLAQIIYILGESDSLIKVSYKHWKTGVLDTDQLIQTSRNLLQTLELSSSKNEAIIEFGSHLHYSNSIKNLVENALKAGILSVGILENYSTFLSLYENVTKYSTRNLKIIESLCEIVQNPYSSSDSSKESKYFDFFRGKSFKVAGDLTKIKLNLVSRLTKDTIYSQTFNYYTYGYWKFDFSSGFYWNQLSNDSYTLTSYNADSTFVTLQKDYSSNNDIAIGGQLHLTYKAADSYGVGINVGAAVSIIDGNTRYLMGGHVLFGRSNQLMLSGGIAIGKVKRLSEAVSSANGFVERDNTVTVPVSFKEPKLVDQVETSVFVGLSYNLGSVFKPRK